jgi:23S rRNA (uridine2552-2'-O)-methyltransferase
MPHFTQGRFRKEAPAEGAPYKKPDFWSLQARREGYPARSVYKLREIDEKFGLLRTPAPGVFKILDLGAAPGSWSLFILRKLGRKAELTAADMEPLSRQYDRGLFEGENFFFIRGDITTAAVREALLARSPYRLVVSDAAPATTGNRSVDTLRSLALAETALDYAENGLCTGGSLAVKVFQGEGTPEIFKRIRTLFKNVKSFKPRACRSGSFETYCIGMDKLG